MFSDNLSCGGPLKSYLKRVSKVTATVISLMIICPYVRLPGPPLTYIPSPHSTMFLQTLDLSPTPLSSTSSSSSLTFQRASDRYSRALVREREQIMPLLDHVTGSSHHFSSGCIDCGSCLKDDTMQPSNAVAYYVTTRSTAFHNILQ